MDTLRHLYRIGNGPSSSHTMAPGFAANRFKSLTPDAERYQVILYGSLAATGRGHFTDRAILDVLSTEKTEILWKPEIVQPFHPNGMEFFALDKEGKTYRKWMVYSVGGGALSEGPHDNEAEVFYPHQNMHQIMDYLKRTGKTYFSPSGENDGCSFIA